MKYGNSLKLTLIYLAAGLIWIYFSDAIVNLFFTSSARQYQTIKGFLYVSLTSIILFLILRRSYEAQIIKLRELKKKERGLRESENRYQLLFKESPLAKIIFSVEDRLVLEVNDQAVRCYGYTRENMLGQPVTDLLSDHGMNAAGAVSRHSLDSGIHTHKRSDGSLIKVEISSHPIRFKGTDCILLVCNDVTQREEAIERLKDNQRRLLSAQRIARIGYWQLGTSTNEIYWSDEVYEIWGVKKESFALNYDAFFQTIHPDDRHLFPAPAPYTFEPLGEYDIEHRILLPDGSVKWVHEKGSLITGDGGIPLFLEGTVQDITAQKLLSISLEESLQRYAYVSKATSDAIWDWDLVNNTIVWGEGFHKLFGYPQGDPDSISSWTDHIAGDDKERVIDGIMKVILGQETYWKDEYRYQKSDGSYIFVVDRGFVIRNEQNKAVRMVGAMRDITEKKKEAIQQELIAEISSAFNEDISLEESLTKTLMTMVRIGHFDMAEAWIVGREKKRINLVARFAKEHIQEAFYSKSGTRKSFEKGQGMPGICWESGSFQYWTDVENDKRFVRADEARQAGIKSIYGLPLRYNNEVLGVLVLGILNDSLDSKIFSALFDSLYSHLGAEIRRKQVEQELNQLFLFAPDIVCMAGTDGFYKKINPALTSILGYSEAELLGRPIVSFVHPDDVERTSSAIANLRKGIPTLYFENRYITKSGKIKWLAWTATPPSDEGLLFSVGKDITDKKELALLLDKATGLASIGAWEIDLGSNQIQWSDITRRIHEVPEDFNPTFDEALTFYMEGKDRAEIVQSVTDTIRSGTSWDIESRIVTARGNVKWVRSIGEAEFADGKCIRVYGSIQDIDRIKRSELAVIEGLKEREIILESIGDAFFTVDSEWTVTYWNNMAEKVLGRKREEIIGRNLWEIYPDIVDTPFYINYTEAVRTGSAQYFEAFYEGTKAWFDVSVFPAPTGLSVFFKDITERHDYIHTIEQHNERLKEIAWSQSHEVRAPLMRILGLTHLIKEREHEVPAELGKMLDMIVVSANALDEITKRINEKTKL